MWLAYRGIGDDAVGGQATVFEFEQPDSPGFGVSMVLQTQQITIGRSSIDTDEDGFTILENLVVCPDVDLADVLFGGDGASRCDDLLDQVVNGSQ